MTIKGKWYLVEVAEFMAGLLKIDKFDLRIKQAKDFGQASECEQLENGDFLITIELGIDYDTMVKHIAHEMVHLRQYKHDQLQIKEDGWYWHGVRHEAGEFMTDEYFLSPWEMEARAMEAWLTYRWDTRQDEK